MNANKQKVGQCTNVSYCLKKCSNLQNLIYVAYNCRGGFDLLQTRVVGARNIHLCKGNSTTQLWPGDWSNKVWRIKTSTTVKPQAATMQTRHHKFHNQYRNRNTQSDNQHSLQEPHIQGQRPRIRTGRKHIKWLLRVVLKKYLVLGIPSTSQWRWTICRDGRPIGQG